MNQANDWGSRYASVTELLDALHTAGFPQERDEETGATTWTFDDGSTLTDSGVEIIVASGFKQATIEAARRDAASHQAEFPGQPIQGDWDSASWQFVSADLDLMDDEHESLWPVYRRELHAEVDRLACAARCK